ncbi:hypothetical protein M434DRAFT_47183, partial [Hypoxylon sp. CO27-5]
LEISAEDFAPVHQGLLPSLTHRGICLRTIISFHWIWSTYYLLTSAHDILAILFVSILQWDLPSEWPCLFGSVLEAYSLRRFWGVFWQRLHVHIIAAYTPNFLCSVEIGQRGNLWWGRRMTNALRALWIFLMSACCHALVNLVVSQKNTIRLELHFFLANYMACLMET